MPITRINEIVHGKRSITVDIAMRLARYLGTIPEVWMNLQQRYDLELAREKLQPELEKTIEQGQLALCGPLVIWGDLRHRL